MVDHASVGAAPSLLRRRWRRPERRNPLRHRAAPVLARSAAEVCAHGRAQAGDVVTTANGGSATIAANLRERAPPGETFTTYNFEVAEFHTYFVGAAGVWVHNRGVIDCEKLKSMLLARADKHGGDFWKAYDDLMANPPQEWLETWPERWKWRAYLEMRDVHFSGQTTRPKWLDLDQQKFRDRDWPEDLLQDDRRDRVSELEDNILKALGASKPGPDFTAHHIVPKVPAGSFSQRYVDDARDANLILKKYGIHPNEAANGTYLPNKHALDQIDYDPGSYGPLHQPLPDPRTHPIGNDLPNLHNETYMAEVAKRLRAADGNGDSVREALQKIGRDLADPDFQFPGTL